jgi:hypothetical protein
VVSDTGLVPIETPEEVHITSGPRWEALLVSLDQAETHLGPPLDGAELARGWTEDLRKMILASVKEIKMDLASEPYVRRDHYKSWVKAEAIDPRVEDTRWSYALGPDGCVRDIQSAEDLLRETLFLIRDLPELTAKQSPVVLESDTAMRMVDALRPIASTLAGGKFVTLGEFKTWDNLLRGCEVERRVLDISYIKRGRERLGVNIAYIERRPSGPVWDRIETYDALLVNVGGRDISHRFETER